MNRLLLLAPRIATNRLWARAGEVPSFHIAPARTGNARDLITGSVLGTYNSASPAWAVGPDGVLFQPAANAPVVDYDPTTLACLGARIREAVTNLFTYSSTFTDSVWSKTNVTITANSATSPAGTTDASLVVPSTSGNLTRRITQAYSTSTPGTYTFSIYVNKNTVSTSNIALRIVNQADTSDVRSNWSTSTFEFGTVNTTGGWTGSTSVQALPNGWFRLSISATTTASSHTALLCQFWPGGYTSTPNTIGSPLVWGAQFQAGTLGPYVPTTTLAASSTADVWDLTSLTAGINNLKTLYFRGRTAASGTRGIASLNDNTANNRLELSTSGTTAKATAATSGSAVADLSGGTIASNTTFRLAARFDADSYALSLNGGAVTTDTSGARALVDRLFIGRDQAGNYMNGYIEEMAGWTRACTDAQVAALAAS